MYKNLNSFVKVLEQKGLLVRISEKVSSELEIAEITDRESKSCGGGKALLFENNETDFPVLTNMFGSRERMALALGVEDLDEPARRIYDIFSKVTAEKHSLFDKMRMIPVAAEASGWLPKRLNIKGECQHTIIMGDEVDLSKLPILKCAPLDGGRFVTLPLVCTVSPETGEHNLGMYRMQMFSKNSTGMHWHCHKTGARHYEEYKRRAERMPVTVCLGGDPVYTYSATAPLPEGIDEFLLAGFLRRRPVELVKSITNDIYIPRDCDFVIEGYVDTSEDKVVEGAFGDHTGFYSLEDMYPIFHVTCVTYCKNAIYPATIVGVPPMEDAYIAEATERLFLAPIRLVAQPDIEDMWMPSAGVAHNIAVMDIEKRYPAQAFKVAQSMWGAGQMMFNKFAVITSSLKGQLTDIDALKTVMKNIDIKRDVLISRGPLDVLDHTSDIMGAGGKLAVDATVKLPEEKSDVCEEAVISDILRGELLSDVNYTYYNTGWATVFASASRSVNFRDAAEEFYKLNAGKGVKFLLIYDEAVDLSDAYTAIWLLGANVEPLRDVVFVDDMLAVDCRAKFGGLNGFRRRWPNVVAMDDDTIRRVDKMWDTLGLGVFKKSPSLNYLKLIFSDKTDV